MPVQEFNENQVTGINPQTGQAVRNYWGYDPAVFFAPKASCSSGGGLGQQKLKFKEMVKAFYAADIEVILDVVFNHTAEGDEQGQHSVSAGSKTRSSICWPTINAFTRTLQARATQSTLTIL
jgi:pullulanase/glycogen debranching enzyme